MAKQLVDLKGFKKVHEDASRAVMANEEGHKIHIVKSALSSDLRKQLSSLPLHQYDPSTAVADQGQFSPPNAPGQVLTGSTPPGPGIAGGPLAAAQDAYATSAQEQQAPQDAQAAQPPAEEAPVDPDEDIKNMPGGKEALSGAELSSKAGQIEASSKANAADSYIKAQQRAETDLKAAHAESTDTINKVTSDILNGHIDPKHYLDNMSSGSKIATAIGLIFGGISQGVNGGQNPAMQFLQGQIQRDLEAQKSNLDNKHNLLSALERQYNDKTQAAHAFAAIDSNLMAAKFDKAAAIAQTPQQQAALLSAKSQFKQQALQYQRQMLLTGLQSKAQGTSDPASADVNANMYLQAARVLDPKGAEDFQKRYVPGIGVATVPLEPKDRDSLAKKTELAGLLNEASDYLDKNKGVGAIPHTANYARAQALQSRIKLIQGEFSDLSRYTPEEAKIYSVVTPDLAGTHLTDQDRAKLNVLREGNDRSLNTLYQQKGIRRQAGDMDSVKVINSQGQSGSIPKSQLQQALKAGYRQVQ